MADSETTYLGLPLMETGGQENNWINVLNDDLFDVIETHMSDVFDLGNDTGGGGRQINGETLLVHLFHYDPEGGELFATYQITLDFDILPPTITKREYWVFDGSTGESLQFRVKKDGVTGSYTTVNKGVSILVIDGATVYAIPEYLP